MATSKTLGEFPTRAAGWSKRPALIVLAGGLVAGALDLTFAFLFYWPQGATPLRILQGIASGVLGRDSFEMGLASAALGAFFHFFISVCAAGSTTWLAGVSPS